MKDQETKNRFIQLRAEGQSYSKIAGVLNISKSTCTAWEKELNTQISEFKREQLKDLYDTYYMTKEARIKQLGQTLAKIEEALADIDFTMIPPEKLLDYKLKYMETLKAEYTGLTEPYMFTQGNVKPKEVVEALGDLLNRLRAGEVTPEQANKESTVLQSLIKAYSNQELNDKLTSITEALEGW